MSARPLLFLDVDGPLIPFGAAGGYPTFQAAPSGNPLVERVDPALGPRLAALGCDLVWATTWTDEANEVIAPVLGLPDLPVVEWPDTSDEDLCHGLHWKTRAVCDWAAGRTFVWVDDEITGADQDWVAGHYTGDALLYRVDASRGLVTADFAALAAWLRG